MSSREVVKALLNKQIPERMGLNEHFWPYIIENAWGSQGMQSDEDMVQRFNLDIRSVSWFEVPGPRPDLAETITESDEWVVTRDGWGAVTKTWKYKAGTPEHVGFSVSTPEMWHQKYRDAVRALDLKSAVDFPALKAAYADAMAGDRFITFSSLFVFEELRKILGDVTMLEAVLLEPDWITDFCTVITDIYIRYFELLFSEVGFPDGMHIYEDLGYTANAFISPQCHRELIHPHHYRLFSMFKDYGLPIILHTCGDFRPHLPAIVESGVDCIQVLEAKTGMNVTKLAEKYSNRLCFMGNINVTVLETGDRDRIRTECLSKINGMKDLRAPYIFMSDHSIPPSVSLADYEYILELYHKNCRY